MSITTSTPHVNISQQKVRIFVRETRRSAAYPFSWKGSSLWAFVTRELKHSTWR